MLFIQLLRIVMSLMILWHLYLAVSHSPGYLFYLWLIELIWILFYSSMIFATYRRKSWCLLFLIVGLFANIWWEQMLAYKITNINLLVQYGALGCLVPLLLFAGKSFKTTIRHSLTLSGGLLLITIMLTSNYYLQLHKEKTIFQNAWELPTNTGQKIALYSDTRFHSNNIIIANFVNESGNYLGYLNLDNQELHDIDEGVGFDFYSTNRGVVYKRPDHASKPARGVIPTILVSFDINKNSKTVVAHLLNPRYELSNPISPSGNQVIINANSPNQWSEYIQSPETNINVYSWIIKQYIASTWMPNSNGLFFLQGESDFKPTSLTMFDLNQKTIMSFPLKLDDDFDHITEIKTSPDGAYFFAKGIKGNIYTLKSDEAERNWIKIISFPTYKWDVGPDYAIVFSVYPSKIGYYNYLDLDKLGQQGIWLYRPDLKNPIRLTSGPDHTPAISPSGDRITFLRLHPAKSSQFAIFNDLMTLKIKKN